MSLMLLVTMALLGFVGGVAAGLLGFGGGVLMFPLLFYVPPLLGLDSLEVKTVAAVVISEVFFATLIGGVAHWRSGRVHSHLAFPAGLTSAAGSFVAGVASRWVAERFLLLLFGIVTLLVAAMMFLPAPSADQENVPLGKVTVRVVPLSLFACITGLVVGFLGAGNFVFVPLLIYLFKVPTRIAIGSSLFIAMMNTSSGFIAKLLTNQIPLILALTVIIGTGAGALAGEWSHRRVSPTILRYLYGGMVGTITLRVWITLLGF